MGIDLSDVRVNWPERYGHLLRVVRLVEGVVDLPAGVRVEIWDDVHGGCQGSYEPASRLVKLWSGSPCMALTLVHELGHSLMRIGPSWLCKPEWYGDSYLSDPEELYARWFTQMVAVETGDKTLNMQLDNVRSFHWTHSEWSREGGLGL